MFSFPNPGQFFGPGDVLSTCKNISCAVGGGVATVSVNKYCYASHRSARSGCQEALDTKDPLRGVAPDAGRVPGGR